MKEKKKDGDDENEVLLIILTFLENNVIEHKLQ